MATRTKTFVFAALAVTGLAVAAPLPAIADGVPVVSLGTTPVGPMRVPFYNTSATPVTTARVVGYGPSPDFAPIYDTSVLQGVTTRPVKNVRISGENVDIEYDNEAAARAPHELPDFSGRHNPALSNLETLPRSLR
jgi:hypothetical protein